MSAPPASSTVSGGHTAATPISPAEKKALRAAIAAYRTPVLGRSWWQIANTFIPLLVVCAAMYASLAVSFWLTFALSVLAAGLVVRVFIIQHDCGHYSFFRSRWANDALGHICSVITCTPYQNWRWQHARHHAHWSNLDRRLSGADIYSGCLTVNEYRKRPRFVRAWYRLLYNPLIALFILPPIIFLLLFRVPFDTPPAWKRERWSVYLTNLALLLAVLVLGYLLGFANVLAVQLPIMVFASIAGVFLFSLQHRFEGATWKRGDDWDAVTASLRSSSYLKLPRILQWFTGNIGFHHVHHLNPGVPNYRLQACHDALPLLRTARTITLRSGLGNARYALWDEARERLVPFPKHESGR